MANELVPLSEGADLSSVGPTRALSTYDWKDPVQRLAFLRCIGAKDAILKDFVGDEIAIQHIVVFWAPFPENEEGEVLAGSRAVFVTPEGDRIRTSSMVALESALVPAKWCGKSLPYNPPCRFKVCQDKGKKPGHTYLYLELLGVD